MAVTDVTKELEDARHHLRAHAMRNRRIVEIGCQALGIDGLETVESVVAELIEALAAARMAAALLSLSGEARTDRRPTRSRRRHAATLKR